MNLLIAFCPKLLFFWSTHCTNLWPKTKTKSTIGQHWGFSFQAITSSPAESKTERSTCPNQEYAKLHISWKKSTSGICTMHEFTFITFSSDHCHLLLTNSCYIDSLYYFPVKLLRPLSILPYFKFINHPTDYHLKFCIWLLAHAKFNALWSDSPLECIKTPKKNYCYILPKDFRLQMFIESGISQRLIHDSLQLTVRFLWSNLNQSYPSFL